MNIRQHDLANPTPKFCLQSEMKEDFDPRANISRGNESERAQALYKNVLDVCPSAVVLTCIPMPKDFQCPLPLTDIAKNIVNENPDCNESELIEAFNIKLSFNDTQLNELEKITRGQDKSKAWKQQRVGCITGTKMREVITKVNTLAKKKKTQTVSLLLVKIFKEKSIKQLESVQWGKIHEDSARSAFFQKTVKAHKNGKLHTSGLITSKSFPYIRASPDNIFTCDCCPESPTTVEYKCPYKIKDKSVSAAWEETDFLEKQGDRVALKRNHKYYTQVTGQMAVKNCSK